ncbi:hypothetical protein ACSQ67_022992 [Phaseolus vulgaris]
MPEFICPIFPSLMMDPQCENRGYVRENHLTIFEFMKLLLEPRERKVEYTKPVYYLGKNKSNETLCFEDNLFLEEETPYFDMGGRFLAAPLSTHTCETLSTLQCLKKYNTFSVPSNMRGFCDFNGKIQKVNQRNTIANEFLLGTDEPSIVNIQAAVMLKSSLLQDKFTGCDLNKNSEILGSEKRKKTVQRVSSFVMASTVFLWIGMDLCSQLSIIQLQPKHGPSLFWSTFLKLFGFMAYVSATSAMIVVGAPFSGTQSCMLMFWAILMLLNSAKSLTEVYLPLMGTILTGCYVLVLKYP